MILHGQESALATVWIDIQSGNAFVRVSGRGGQAGLQPGYVPSEDEIAAGCARIQAGWSDSERERRRMFPGRVDWYAPKCQVELSDGMTAAEG